MRADADFAVNGTLAPRNAPRVQHAWRTHKKCIKKELQT